MGFKKACEGYGCILGIGMGALLLVVAFSQAACPNNDSETELDPSLYDVTPEELVVEPPEPEDPFLERVGQGAVEGTGDLIEGGLNAGEKLDWEGLGRQTVRTGRKAGEFFKGAWNEWQEGSEDSPQDPQNNMN